MNFQPSHLNSRLVFKKCLQYTHTQMTHSTELFQQLKWSPLFLPLHPLLAFLKISVILLKHKSFHNLPKDFLLHSQHLQWSSRSCYVAPIISLISFPTTVSLFAPLLPNGLLISLQTSQAYSHLWPLHVLLSAQKALLSDTCMAHPPSFFRSLCYYIIFSMRPSLTTLHKAAIQHSKSTAYSP